MIAPQTDIILVHSPLELTDLNQLTFENITAQFNYFYNLPKIQVDGATYQRKDNVIRFPASYDDILQYNYVMYRNEGYSNKWFYAFIEKMDYINDNMTAITIKEDVFQTWQFDFEYKQTFVEREHTNDDTVGYNTIPENLELGEYQIVDLRNSPMWETTSPSTDWMPCFCVTKLPTATTNVQNGYVRDTNGYIGNAFSSLKFFAVRTLTAAQKIIEIYDNDSDLTSDAIVNIYMIPQCCVDINLTTGNIASTGNTPSTVNAYELYPILNSYTSSDYDLQMPIVLSGNYSPKNAKLLTYPFSYFYVTNNCGEEVVYHYEDFPFKKIDNVTRRTMTYRKAIVASCGVSAKLYFTNYKDYASTVDYGTKLYNYGINYAKIPVCAWTTDYYTNWLTQNGVNVALNIASAAVSAGAGLMSGNPIGMAGGVINAGMQVADTLAEVHKAAVTPPQANGDINTGDLMFAYLRCSISFYEMSIRPEVAAIIDDYFSKFGYATKRIKIPNITGRLNWNYVKTIDSYVGGNIPQDSLNEYKEMLNRGITFWHNPSTFMDYSQANGII